MVSCLFLSNLKMSHYTEIVDRFATTFGVQIQEILNPYINQFRNKPLNLAVQTVFWCLRDYIELLNNKTQQREDDIEPIHEEDMTKLKYKEYIGEKSSSNSTFHASAVSDILV